MAGRQVVSRFGRQQRSLLGSGAGDQEADAAGDLRAAVYVQSGDIESSISAEGIGRCDADHVSAPVVWSGARRVQKREERLGTLARTCAAARGGASAPLRIQFRFEGEGSRYKREELLDKRKEKSRCQWH